jgi:hypothetical protein
MLALLLRKTSVIRAAATWWMSSCRPHEWHWVMVFRRRDIEGAIVSGDVMRRRAPDGTWQYRKPTPAEWAERQQDNAW